MMTFGGTTDDRERFVGIDIDDALAAQVVPKNAVKSYKQVDLSDRVIA